MITFDAHFDGEKLCPEEPVILPQNVRLRVSVVEPAAARVSDAGGKQSEGLFEGIFGGETIEGPEDWAAELDHYLYGTPKRGNDPTAWPGVHGHGLRDCDVQSS